MARRRKLTDGEWQEVFALRCRSKEGKPITKRERALVDRAFNEDEDRYAAMEPEVFDATVPYGSSVRWPR